MFPPLSEDITDDNGSSDITEEKPGKGEDTDGDGVEDKPGEIETVTYKVSVNDTKGIINNAFVEIKGRQGLCLHFLTRMAADNFKSDNCNCA